MHLAIWESKDLEPSGALKRNCQISSSGSEGKNTKKENGSCTTKQGRLTWKGVPGQAEREREGEERGKEASSNYTVKCVRVFT